MSDIKLFQTDGPEAHEILGSAVALEKTLQDLMERNLEVMLGVRFLASEYSTGPKHGGRIDSLGLDENRCPVIIEYKRNSNENVINQGLFYLDWLMDHRAEFEMLTAKKLSPSDSSDIDWSAPRLICIAGGFTKYDEHAVQQMNRNIELVRYRKFGEGLLLLELVNATSTTSPAATPKSTSPSPSPATYKTITQVLTETTGPLRSLYDELRAYLLSLGEDVQERTTKFYMAFKRIKNFACVEVHPSKQCISIYLKVDPDTTTLGNGFARDVRKIGHFGTGDLELTIRSSEDFQRAHALIAQSYEAS